MPRGGRRHGAGRPKKSDAQRFVDGNAGHRGRVLPHPSVPPPATVVVEEFDAPNDLSFDERQVWMELAPHAFKAGTLTPTTSANFTAFCKWVLIERQFAGSVTERGSTKHASAMKLANQGYDDFGLRPKGKPMPGVEKTQAPVNPLSRFLTRAQ